MMHTIKKVSLSLLLITIAPHTFCSQPAADNSAVQDPYYKAHQLFKDAACKDDYEQVVEEYEKQYDNATAQQRAIATTNKGEAKLALDYIEDGFKDRDARLQCPSDARLFKAGTFVTASKPLNTQSNLKDATVAVYCDEGGIGDIYFFSRYMKELKKQGAKVVAVATTGFVQKILNTLKSSDMIDETALFTGKYDPCTEVEYDYDIHMMSLPVCLSSQGLVPTTINTIPTPPYLQGAGDLVEKWKKEINSKKGLHIAYCFEASKQAAGVYRMLDRNIKPEVLESTMESAGNIGQLYCIHGPGYTPAKNIINVADAEKEHGVPFAHTIALLTALRESKNGLFVGVDTGPTNAALAVGTRGYVLSPRVADWRWGHAKTQQLSDDQTPSAWAPTLKILRQDTQGDWSVPLKNLTAGLQELSKQIEE